MQRQTCSSFIKASQRRPILLSSHIQPGKFCSPPATAASLPAMAEAAPLVITAVPKFQWVFPLSSRKAAAAASIQV